MVIINNIIVEKKMHAVFAKENMNGVDSKVMLWFPDINDNKIEKLLQGVRDFRGKVDEHRKFSTKKPLNFATGWKIFNTINYQ